MFSIGCWKPKGCGIVCFEKSVEGKYRLRGSKLKAQNESTIMNNRFLIVLVVAWQLTLALCTRAGSTQPTSFTYNGFSKATSIQFNGSATNVTTSDGPVLQLTPASASKAGSAFTSNSVTLAPNAGFSTFFTFRLSQPGGPTPAGGITFTIQSASPFILGSAGSGHGYGGISNSLTVVFATSTNGTLAGNHVAVNINGQLNEPVSASVTNAALNDGNIWYAWIDYDGVHGLLEVRLAQGPVRPPAVTLAAVVNLPGILGGTNVVATGNLLTNGDFESEPNWGGGVSYDGGETALVGSELPGWTIEPGHAVTIHNSPGPYLVISNTYSVNTDGEGYNGHNANFYQDFDSTTLASYALTFNWQSWGQYGTPTTSKLMVSVTDTVTSAVLFTGLYSYDGSAPHPVHLVTANFPGTGHPLRLRVEESPESGYNDNTYMVDNFSVTAGSPPLGAYVGFTGGTGAGWNQQDILSWKFMALPTARFIGHYALTNISPNFRLTNGFAFKSYFYQVNGVTYTNIYAYRENFTQEPDGSVDFVTDPESSPIVDTSHGPDTTDGGGDQVEWMQMLSEYDDTVSGTPTSGIIAPLSVPVPTGQTFEQSFNGISEAFAQSQLEALDPSLLQLPAPPTDA